MKISIIGAGNVGGSCALKVCEKGLADEVILLDICKGIPQGKALDILQAMPLNGSNSRIIGTNDYSDIKDSDIVVVTAGVPRKPGMTREDLVDVNSKIISSIASEIKIHAPNSIVIVVTNPLDIMAHLMLKETGFDTSKVLGMAGVLDSTRFRTFLAMETGAKVEYIEAMVLGGHGDSMVPLADHVKINGKPVSEILEPEKLKRIVERTKNGGAEIVKLLKSGSAFYAPSASIIEMISSIVNVDETVLPCSVYLSGEYGYEDIFLGVPVKLDKNGVKGIVELEIAKDEKVLLDKSAEAVRKVTEDL